MTKPQTGRELVSFFLPHLELGGVERAILNLAAELVRQGFECHVVVAADHGSARPAHHSGVSLVDLERRRTLAAVEPLTKYLADQQPIALVSSKTHANVVAAASRFLSGSATRLILVEHSRYQFEQRGTVRDRAVLALAAKLYPTSDAIVAVDPDVADACAARLRLDRRKISVVANPVVTEALGKQLMLPAPYAWIGERPVVFLGVGRLVPEKDFETLIRAFARTTTQIDARLVILGEGPLRSRLERLVRCLNLESSVELPGVVDRPLPYMRDADFFVLSSRSEGFPMVLVEALFAGTPCIATRCSRGVAEILDHGSYGTLIPVGDTAALADAMTRLALAERRGDAARLRLRAEEFTAERTALRYLDLLRSPLPHGQEVTAG